MTKKNINKKLVSKNYAFTLNELLVVILLIGTLSVIGVGSYKYLTKSSKNTALDFKINQVNAAFRAYETTNSLDVKLSDQDRVDLLKMKSLDPKRDVGMHSGALLDPRTKLILSKKRTKEKYVWDSESRSFVLGAPDDYGIIDIVFDEKLANKKYGYRSEGIKPFLYASKSGWVWNTENTKNAGTATLTIAGSNPQNNKQAANGKFVSKSGSQNKKNLWQLLPPLVFEKQINGLFELSSGTYPRSAFDVQVELKNPNKSGTSKIIYQINNGNKIVYKKGTILNLKEDDELLTWTEGLTQDYLNSSSKIFSFYNIVNKNLKLKKLHSPILTKIYPDNTEIVANGGDNFQNAADFPLKIKLKNPNLAAISKLKYSINDGPELVYKNTAFEVKPGDTVKAWFVSTSPQFDDSDTITSKFIIATSVKTLLAPEIVKEVGASEPPQSFIDGTYSFTQNEFPIKITLKNPNQYGSSEIKYTINGGAPTTYALGIIDIQPDDKIIAWAEPLVKQFSKSPNVETSFSVKKSNNKKTLLSPLVYEVNTNKADKEIPQGNYKQNADLYPLSVKLVDKNPDGNSQLKYSIDDGVAKSYNPGDKITINPNTKLIAWAEPKIADYLPSDKRKNNFLIIPNMRFSFNAPDLLIDIDETILKTPLIFHQDEKGNLNELTQEKNMLPFQEGLLSILLRNPNNNGISKIQYRINDGSWQNYSPNNELKVTFGSKIEVKTVPLTNKYKESPTVVRRLDYQPFQSTQVPIIKTPLIFHQDEKGNLNELTQEKNMLPFQEGLLSILLRNPNNNGISKIQYRINDGSWQNYSPNNELKVTFGSKIEVKTVPLTNKYKESPTVVRRLDYQPFQSTQVPIIKTPLIFHQDEKGNLNELTQEKNMLPFQEGLLSILLRNPNNNGISKIQYRINDGSWQNYSPNNELKVTFGSKIEVKTVPLTNKYKESPTVVRRLDYQPFQSTQVPIIKTPLIFHQDEKGNLNELTQEKNMLPFQEGLLSILLRNPNNNGISKIQYRINDGSWQNYSPNNELKVTFGSKIEVKTVPLTNKYKESPTVVRRLDYQPFQSTQVPIIKTPLIFHQDEKGNLNELTQEKNMLPFQEGLLSILLRNPNNNGISKIQYRINDGSWQNYSPNNELKVTFGSKIEVKTVPLTNKYKESPTVVRRLDYQPFQSTQVPIIKTPLIFHQDEKGNLNELTQEKNMLPFQEGLLSILLRNPNNNGISKIQYRINDGSWQNYSPNNELKVTFGSKIEVKTVPLTNKYKESPTVVRRLDYQPFQSTQVPIIKTPLIFHQDEKGNLNELTQEKNMLPFQEGLLSILLRNPNNNGISKIQYRINDGSWQNYSPNNELKVTFGSKIEVKTVPLTNKYKESPTVVRRLDYQPFQSTQVPIIKLSSLHFDNENNQLINIEINNPNKDQQSHTIQYKIVDLKKLQLSISKELTLTNQEIIKNGKKLSNDEIKKLFEKKITLVKSQIDNIDRKSVV